MYQILVFLTAAAITLFSTPALIKVAFLKRLFDMPDFDRKMHVRAVPTIGGIIIFASTLFSYSLWFPNTNVGEFKFIVVCMLLLFFVGIKDDIIGTAPIKKLMAHILVGLVLVLMAGIKLVSLHGLFEIQLIPDYASIFLSLFTYIVIVNAMNLIDGVDGLAAGVGCIASLTFGTWFYLTGENGMACLSFSLAGSLFSFLIFNFSPARIFMGDSGSLTIGLILSVLAIKMVEQPIAEIPALFSNASRPVLAMAILIYPLYDTLRVFILRAIKGQSPFSADKNHIHHRLLAIGLTHAQTSIILYLATITVITVAIVTSNFGTTLNFASVAIVSLLLGQVPFIIKKKRFDI